MGDMADMDMYRDPFDDEGDEGEDCIFHVTLIAQTKKAYLLECKHGQFWIPKSIATLDEGGVCFPGWFKPDYQVPGARSKRQRPPREDFTADQEFEDLDEESDPE